MSATRKLQRKQAMKIVKEKELKGAFKLHWRMFQADKYKDKDYIGMLKDSGVNLKAGVL
jgi:hypothetical protein